MNKGIIFVSGLVTGFLAGFVFEHHKKDTILEVIPVKEPEETQRTAKTVTEKPKLDQYVQYSDSKSTDSGIHDRSVEADSEVESPRESVLYPTDDAPDEEENDEDDDPDLDEEPFSSKPDIMTLMEFENEKKHYDTETLTYYTYDDTVCNDKDEVIATPEDLIGEDALVCFGMGSQDPNVVYICNDRRSTKYEVVKVDAAYSETVLGMKYEPKVTNKSKRREDSDFD